MNIDIFGRLRKHKASPVGSNRVDELANRLAREGKVADIEARLEALDTAILSEPELESWYHLRGVDAFRRGDRALAKSRLSEAYAKFPGSAMIAFSLGQEYEYVGDTASMFELFDRFRFPSLSSKHAFAQSRYAYLWSDIDRAFRYLEPVMEMHFELRGTDDMFLYLRGMPFFSQTWAYFAAFSELQNDLSKIEALTREAGVRLKEYDVSHHLEVLSCMKAGDFSRYASRPGYGTGYERTRAAAILSLSAGSFQEAKEILRSVRVPASDLPWLTDILLLSQCEAAHRLEPAAEPKLLDRFFLRQPLLFEPDHAFNFRLLDYQESLKRIYRSRKA